MNGLRIVACVNAPSPWSLAARALFDHKQLTYHLGEQFIADDNHALTLWTGQNSAPVVAFRSSSEQEKIATTAETIVLLAERLEPNRALIPLDPQQRAWMFGLLQALAGEDGFGWNRRFMSLSVVDIEFLPDNIRKMALKYDYNDALAAVAEQRVAQILGLFSETLRQQHERGSAFLVGDALSALDLYFAIFIGIMYRPLADEALPIPSDMRAGYEVPSAILDAAAKPILYAHRDRIFQQYLTPFMAY
tara:strand:+ start:2110 stop:2853 length:744 start_codon:yes stop_codon:yes gene_type:complete